MHVHVSPRSEQSGGGLPYKSVSCLLAGPCPGKARSTLTSYANQHCVGPRGLKVVSDANQIHRNDDAPKERATRRVLNTISQRASPRTEERTFKKERAGKPDDAFPPMTLSGRHSSLSARTYPDSLAQKRLSKFQIANPATNVPAPVQSMRLHRFRDCDDSRDGCRRRKSARPAVKSMRMPNTIWWKIGSGYAMLRSIRYRMRAL